MFDGDQLTPDDVDDALPVEAHVDSYEPDTEVSWIEPPLRRERKGTTATRLLGAGFFAVGSTVDGRTRRARGSRFRRSHSCSVESAWVRSLASVRHHAGAGASAR